LLVSSGFAGLNLDPERNSMATVFLPTPLRRYADGQSKVQVDGATLGDILTNLDTAYPGLKDRLFDESGEIKRFIQVFVNEEDVRALQGQATPVGPRDEVSIVPAMAGGRQALPDIVRSDSGGRSKGYLAEG